MNEKGTYLGIFGTAKRSSENYRKITNAWMDVF